LKREGFVNYSYFKVLDMDRMEKPSSGFRYARVPVNIEAEYEFKGIKGKCNIVDISEGGMKIQVKQVFVPGDMIRVKFPIIHEGKVINIDAWCIVRNSSGNEIGVEFDELSNEHRKLLITYVENLLLRHGKDRYEPIE
jgi:c-di-GMP-binding flagellar brake protein YcgR